MKILQLGKFYPIRGGVEKVMYDLISGLSKLGVECDMMCAETKGSGTVRDIDTGAHIHSFHSWAKIASTTIAPSMISSLRGRCNEYDLIHIHHPDPMAAIALRMSGYKGPVVLHWHADIIKSKTMLKVYEPLQEWLIRRSDVIVTTSPVTIEHSPALARHRSRTLCIPIGITGLTEDIEEAPSIRQRFAGKKIIFSLGRLVPYKGYKYLLEAATMLPDDYVVLIGGEGPLRDSLEHMRQSSGVNDKVIFLGRVPDDMIPAYYSACDIFCLPSVMKTEAFGIVQIEAMSLGKPVVATKIKGSGTAWVNKSGVSGLNVDPGDARQLADALRSIGDDPELYARLSAGARERFHSTFTLDCMVNQCHELYKTLIKQN
jgi:rhamnosyl/mannosyltransferase